MLSDIEVLPIIPRYPSITLENVNPALSICDFVIDSESYGLGIRIGIYVQILALWFARHYLLSNAYLLDDSAIVFRLALCAVCIKNAVISAGLSPVEILIPLQLLAYACIMGPGARRIQSRNFKHTFVQKILHEAINLCMICLHTWFWWHGLYHSKEPACRVSIMLLVKTNIFGWARTFMQVVSLLFLIQKIGKVASDIPTAWETRKLRKTIEELEDAVRLWKAANKPSPMMLISDGNVGVLDHMQDVMHDCCSRYSCSMCSPTEQVFNIDGDSTLAPSRSSENSASSFTTTPISMNSNPGHWPLDLGSNPQLAILRQVYESEKYIERCISSGPYLQSDNRGSVTRCWLNKTFFQQNDTSRSIKPATTNTLFTPAQTSEITRIQCQIRIWKALFNLFRPTPTLAVYKHLRESRQFDLFNSPFQLYASTSHHNNADHAELTYISVSIAAAMIQSHSNSSLSTENSLYSTFFTLTVHILFIAQIELTLKWNQLSNISGFNMNLGQLIPLLIGLWSLQLAIVQWLRMWRGKMNKKKDENGPKTHDPEKGLRTQQHDEEGHHATGLPSQYALDGFQRWKVALLESERRH